MLIDKATIARLLPHAGAMCLLDGVESWDAERIRCVTDSHRHPDNPLRRNGALGILCGVEYAAQAMALHGALTGGADGVRRGYLASVRGVSCHVDRLDNVAMPLTVEAVCLHQEAGRAMYGFTVRDEGRCLIEGQAVAVFESIPA